MELCGDKEQQRWLWHAIDHETGMIVAYTFGTRADEVFLELKALLAPFGITRFYTDGWGACERHVEAEKRVVGKTNIQKIERKHLTLPTRIKRLVRKTICLSKLIEMQAWSWGYSSIAANSVCPSVCLPIHLLHYPRRTCSSI